MIKPWRPVAENCALLEVHSIQYPVGQNIIIILTEDRIEHRRRLRIEVESVIAFRMTDEGKRILSIPNLPEHELRSGHSLYFSDESEFIDWIRRESSGTLDGVHLTHFIIATHSSEFIDILAVDEPKVSWLRLNE